MIIISLITAGPHWTCDSSCTVPCSKKCSWWALTTCGNMHILFYRLSCLYNHGKPFFFFFSFCLLLFFPFLSFGAKHHNICFSPEVTFDHASMCNILCLWYQWNCHHKWQVCGLMFHMCFLWVVSHVFVKVWWLWGIHENLSVWKLCRRSTWSRSLTW